MDINGIPFEFYLPQYFRNTDEILDNSLKISQLALSVYDKCQEQEKIIAEQKDHIETLKSQVKFLTWYIEHGRSEICEEW